jgi:hypothetical protein
VCTELILTLSLNHKRIISPPCQQEALLRSVVRALGAGLAHSVTPLGIISGGSGSSASAAAAAGSVRRSSSADGGSSSGGSSSIAATLAKVWLAVLNKLLQRVFTAAPLGIRPLTHYTFQSSEQSLTGMLPYTCSSMHRTFIICFR